MYEKYEEGHDEPVTAVRIHEPSATGLAPGKAHCTL